MANTLSRGDTVLVPKTGRFGVGWGEIAKQLGCHVELIDFGDTTSVDAARVAEVLAADKAHKIKAVLAVHVDTSTSVRSDVAAIRRAIDAADHPALLMADCIASFACDRFEMDAWGVDVMVTASQKGLMTPAGMAYVFFNAKAAAACGNCVTGYWDWRRRATPEVFYEYWYGTAPSHHIFGQRQALDMIFAEGVETVWARHAIFAQAIWAAVDQWAKEGPMHLNVPNPAHRSNAVTSCVAGSPNGDRLRNWCEQTAGLTLGIGLGRTPPDAYFRIGHMGHLNPQMILGVLATIEAGLQALDIAHGSGAVDAAAAVIAAAGAQKSGGQAAQSGCCG